MLNRSPWPVILQIVPELSTGGAERTTIEIAEAVTLGGGLALVVSAGGRLEKELADVGGELIRFPAQTKNPGVMLFNALRLARIIRERGVSLVHARSRAPAWSAFLAARRKKRCFVTTYHGIYNQKGRLKAYYNAVMAKGDAVICNSQYTACIVRERHPEAAEPRRRDLSRLRRGEVRSGGGRGGARARLTRSPGASRKGSASSSFRPGSPVGKGSAFLSTRRRLCTRGGRTATWLSCWSATNKARSPYRAELKALIDSHGLADRVIVAGHCDDMPAAYKAACLTVLPSIEPEAFGRSAVEAQAMGCPVIASRIGAFPETIVAEPTLLARVASVPEGAGPEPQAVPQRSNPWLFEPGNPEALCESLCAAVALSGDALEAIRARNMERVRASFSKRALQLQTLSVYDRLIGTQLAAAFKNATQK